MLQILNLSFEREGEPLFQNLNFNFNDLRYGLVGHNGVGKSTLAAILAGRLAPSGGSVHASGEVALFDQMASRNKAEFVYEAIADAWAYQGRYESLFREWLKKIRPEQRLSELSGGEWMRVRLLETLTKPHAFLILDEPTNHLDVGGRQTIYELLEVSSSVMVISHDREVLRRTNVILELTQQGLKSFTGSFDDFWAERAASRKREADLLREAKRSREKEKRDRVEKIKDREAIDKRGKEHAHKKGLPRIILGGMQRRAEVTTGKLRVQVDAATAEANLRADEAWKQIQKDPFLRLDFSAAEISRGSVFFEAKDLNLKFGERVLWQKPLSFQMKSGERWRLIGENGSGKSTLLKLMANEATQASISGAFKSYAKKVAYFDQDLREVDAEKTLLEVLAEDSRFDLVSLRNELAFYGFTKEKVNQKISSLSGGERLRAALAKLFLSATIPQGILLDEPTTHLDFQSLELLEKALNEFPGFIVIATHDDEFAAAIGVTDAAHI